MKKSNLAIAFSTLILACSCSDDTTENVLQNDTNAVVNQNTLNRETFRTVPIEGSYIVVYKDNVFSNILNRATEKSDVINKTSNVLGRYKVGNQNVSHYYSKTVKGFAVKLNEQQLAELKLDPNVAYIEQDQMITYAPPSGKPGGGGGSTSGQVIPYGTTRVGGGNTTSTRTAWVIDSGIDLDHPDLNVDVTRSVSFLTGSPSNTSPDDQNGHGTHVAGTIAAIDNNIGTVGVAPGSTVVAVRVLDRRGSGSISGVIAGVEYVRNNGAANDVANMSLGGGISQTLDNAVINATSGGVKFVLAAGNESDDANNHSPARANGNNIYTISAMDVNDNFAGFSNYGTPVDYCAPGVSIQSTWKDGGYNTISGTSMAAPHAAGVLLLGNPSTDGTVNGDPDGSADPIIHT
ncbi:S8 family peptidase [Flavobacterium chuncheonense]|uniref:S8 family peptidase n=1 Tax=Flavobacterium chuncheonense TaxID=2026653 RepID=A0ABW5YP19_9FLAO